MQTQSTNNILMIRPKNFQTNQETIASNTFQNPSNITDAKVLAFEEFDDMVHRLKNLGVNVMVFEDTRDDTPDSVFPNNWVSFHHSGSVILYPLFAQNRRKERRMDIIDTLKMNFHVDQIIDLTYFENENLYLEGTGSLVLDRINKIAYCCLSDRSNPLVLEAWKEKMSRYNVISFSAFDDNNNPIFNTDMMLSIGQNFAVVCLEAIPDLDERFLLSKTLENSGKYLIPISMQQMKNFSGNILEVKSKQNKKIIVMSTNAYFSFSKTQIRTIEEYGEIHHFNLDVIESCGGGSARSLMAEIHLPSKANE